VGEGCAAIGDKLVWVRGLRATKDPLGVESPLIRLRIREGTFSHEKEETTTFPITRGEGTKPA
jgi:hypothetical protein